MLATAQLLAQTPDRMLDKPGECDLSDAHDSLNHVSKLGMVLEEKLGVVDSWGSTFRIPVRAATQQTDIG